MKLLVVEDSERLRESLARGLRRSGHAVDAVGDGLKGLAFGRSRQYDAIVLDLVLPSMHGLDLLATLRDDRVSTPVIALTALDRVEDRVRGLRGGADDYLVKPFEFDELLARLEALVRRRDAFPSTTIRVGPDLVIDLASRAVTCGAREVVLTAREYAILELLARRKGAIVSRADVEERVYEDRRPIASNAVDSAMCLIRGKLLAAGCSGAIRTRRGLGYVLDDPDGRERTDP